MSGFVRRLRTHSEVDPADEAALLALPFTLRGADPHAYLVREGDEPEHCCVLVRGYAYRHKMTGEGQRQILAFYMAGDFIDLHNLFLDVSDHGVQALTRSEIGLVPRREARALIEARPKLARALWADTLIDASVFREWLLNVGRRPAIARVAHLLCELMTRMDLLGLSSGGSYELPMTQEQIADSTGLTPVHVNRVLQDMGKSGFIVRTKRSLSVPDWERLCRLGDFNARYMHAGAATGERRAA